MNTNLVHNILNLTIVVVSAIAIADLTPFMSEELALQVTAGAASLKLIMNSIRDGVTGLMAQQPPVVKGGGDDA